MERLSEQIRGASSTLYDNESFKITLESNLHLITRPTNSTQLPVNKLDAMRFRGDLVGYLFNINVPMELHWITMRCSGLTCYTDFDENTESITIPISGYISNLLLVHQTQYTT